jgi:hypothetical protein
MRAFARIHEGAARAAIIALVTALAAKQGRQGAFGEDETAVKKVEPGPSVGPRAKK